MSGQSALAPLLEQDAALKSFWDRNIRLPSKQRNGARHVVCIRSLGDELFWLNDDAAVHIATDISLSQAVGRQDPEHRTLVRIPALHVQLCAAEFAGDHLDFQLAIEARLEELSVPAPHFMIWDPRGDGHISMVWQVEPLRLPKNRDANAQHSAYARLHNAWMRARIKIAAAFEELGGVVSLKDAPCPLPHAAPLLGPDEDAYILSAELDLPDYRIQSISEPLNGTPWDTLAQQMLNISLEAVNSNAQELGAEVYRLSAGHWLHMPKYRAALGPQKRGERHNAAKRVVCHQRWAGASYASLQNFMMNWNAVQPRPLPEAELFDSKSGLVIWAVNKLVKGGPSRKKQVPLVRGHYSRGDDVVDAILSYLAKEGAAKQDWVGTIRELADCVSIDTGVVVSERTLFRKMSRLEERGVSRLKRRVGSTLKTDWRLKCTGDSESDESGPDARIRLPTPHRVAGAVQSPQIPISDSDVLVGQNPVFDLEVEGSNSKLKGGVSQLEGVLELFPSVFDPHKSFNCEFVNQKDSSLSEEKFEELAAEIPFENPLVFESFVNEEVHFIEEVGKTKNAQKEEVNVCADQAARGPGAFGAQKLIEAGLSLLPLKVRKKQPLAALLPKVGGKPSWASFCEKKASLEVVSGWLGRVPELNLGIVCGRISNVVALDMDSMDAVRWATKNLPPPLFRVQTGRQGGGQHWFYRYPDGVESVSNASEFRGRKDIQVRGDGGYVVAPGSVHASGTVYKLLDALCIDDSAIFDPAWTAVLEKPVRGPALFNMNALRRERVKAFKAGDRKKARALSGPALPCAGGEQRELPEVEELLVPIRALLAEGKNVEAKAAFLKLFESAPEPLLGRLFMLQRRLVP